MCAVLAALPSYYLADTWDGYDRGVKVGGEYCWLFSSDCEVAISHIVPAAQANL